MAMSEAANKPSIRTEDLSSLRDRLLEEKVTAKNQQVKRDEAVDKVKTALAKIPKEKIEELRTLGFDVESVINPDFERLKTDKEYLENYKSKAIQLITKVTSRLESLLK